MNNATPISVLCEITHPVLWQHESKGVIFTKGGFTNPFDYFVGVNGNLLIYKYQDATYARSIKTIKHIDFTQESFTKATTN